MDQAKKEDLKNPGFSPKDAPAQGAISIERKLTIVFWGMFLIPAFAALFLFKEFFKGNTYSSFVQVLLFSSSVVLLGTAGYLAVRLVVNTLLKITKEAEAVANGDISRRMEMNGSSEINQLASHFNRVVEKLEKTVENLQVSRKLTHELLSQLCSSGNQPGDMTPIFKTCLKTLFSITGFDVGAIFIVSSDGKMLKARMINGLPKAFDGIIIPVGHGAAGRVASTGHVEAVPELTHIMDDKLSEFEKSMSCSMHVPMIAGGKPRGVVSIGMLEGSREVGLEDIQIVRNLANQIAVALENVELKEKEEKVYIETVAALSAAVEARDMHTRGHSRRVTEFSIAMAKGMNTPGWFMKDIESAALLHDIGKIGFTDDVLRNIGPLPPKDVPMIRNHPVTGESILKPVGTLSRLCSIIRHHHERYDGAGYPDGLKGEEIPLASRIIAVADSFDAMISGRHYMPNRKTNEAISELKRYSGSQFDPGCVRVFLNHLAGKGIPVSF